MDKIKLCYTLFILTFGFNENTSHNRSKMGFMLTLTPGKLSLQLY